MPAPAHQGTRSDRLRAIWRHRGLAAWATVRVLDEAGFVALLAGGPDAVGEGVASEGAEGERAGG